MAFKFIERIRKVFFSLWKTALSRKDGGISQISPVNWKQEEASPSTTFAWWRIWWLLKKIDLENKSCTL